MAELSSSVARDAVKSWWPKIVRRSRSGNSFDTMTDNTRQGLQSTANRTFIPMLRHILQYLICVMECVDKLWDKGKIKSELFLRQLKINNPKYMHC